MALTDVAFPLTVAPWLHFGRREPNVGSHLRWGPVTRVVMEVSVAIEDRGFASMDRAKQREIASRGGKAAHRKGSAHEWKGEEAREAGRKGGIVSHQRRKMQLDNLRRAADVNSSDIPSGVSGSTARVEQLR